MFRAYDDNDPVSAMTAAVSHLTPSVNHLLNLLALIYPSLPGSILLTVL